MEGGGVVSDFPVFCNKHFSFLNINARSAIKAVYELNNKTFGKCYFIAISKTHHRNNLIAA